MATPDQTEPGKWDRFDTILTTLSILFLAGDLVTPGSGLVGIVLGAWEIIRRVNANETNKAYRFLKTSHPDLPWDEPYVNSKS